MFPTISHSSSDPLRELIAAFPPFEGEVEADSFRNFLGVRTRCKYLPPVYTSFAGKILRIPTGANGDGLHDPIEWAGVLTSVLEARGSLGCIELGAGWGPWLSCAAVAARRRGIEKIKLVAVESDPANLEFMRTHFLDNGIDPSRYKIIRAICSAKTRRDRRLLSDLVAELPLVNFVHCDIQGAEIEVIGSAINALNGKVRRLIVGTHGRDIDAKLLALMSANGWRLENEKVSVLDENLALVQDGTQSWVNPRIAIE